MPSFFWCCSTWCELILYVEPVHMLYHFYFTPSLPLSIKFANSKRWKPNWLINVKICCWICSYKHSFVCGQIVQVMFLQNQITANLVFSWLWYDTVSCTVLVGKGFYTGGHTSIISKGDTPLKCVLLYSKQIIQIASNVPILPAVLYNNGVVSCKRVWLNHSTVLSPSGWYAVILNFLIPKASGVWCSIELLKLQS